ncbi:polyketide cyclase [Mycobacterium sp.]|uniref:polyketide cyclase n=1 Tax=Mycobacterium sp. TaxID=1785 RepID=UPI0025E73832|nr:polyketide cyclase [Mycobacterium sp.]
MTNDTTLATITIPASAEAVFGILADPTTHEAIDGTGWVRESLDGATLTRNGQVFRIAMYHDNHPDKNYEMANQVVVFDRPNAIAWQPGQDPEGDGNLSFGGWIWRYDISDAGPSETHVTLTYDWSGVPPETREHIGFPPFAPSHLENSLKHLSDLASARE